MMLGRITTSKLKIIVLIGLIGFSLVIAFSTVILPAGAPTFSCVVPEACGSSNPDAPVSSFGSLLLALPVAAAVALELLRRRRKQITEE